MNENVIEWITGEDVIAVTLSQKKYITKVKKLAQKYPDDVKILSENKDGSIFAHLPLKFLKLYVINGKELSEEEKEIRARRLRKKREENG